MRRAILIFITVSTLIVALASAKPATSSSSSSSEQAETQLIDIKADLVYPHKIDDTLSVLCLVGRFAAQHNGAVITADSAVRFENDRLECFGNVLINKNTTYAYADEMIYDGNTNLASLISPLIKVIDEDVTMYVHNFTFNTLSNIGEYWDNGITIKSGENEDGEPTESVMESQRGYYYSDTKQVVGVESVELSGDGYLLSGDSVVYDMSRERAYFFDNTHIWSGESDYIYGDSGIYDGDLELCVVNRNSYLLTAEQEAWSDTMQYYMGANEAILYGNIQIDDTTNKSMIFAHFAHYWGDEERVVLTRNPALVNYDGEGEQIDTLFLRGDTIMLNTRFVAYVPPPVEEQEQEQQMDEEQMEYGDDMFADSMGLPGVMLPGMDHIDSLFMMMDQVMDGMLDSTLLDSTTIDSLMVDSLMDMELPIEEVVSKSELRRAERTARLEQKRQAKLVAEHERLIERRERLNIRIAERVERGKSIYSDSVVLLRVVSMLHSDSVNWGFVADELLVDSLGLDSLGLDSLELDSLGLDSLGLDSLADSTLVTEVISPSDSVYRTVIAFGNVATYRNDIQMVCDSMVVQSIDSTMRLHHSPILWTGVNQVVAKEMIYYIINGVLDYADFFGNPIMSSEIVDFNSTYYNQITGKTMKLIFEDGQVVQNDADGNVRTIYFMQDEATGEVNTISNIESGDASFYIDNQALTGLTYRSSPTYILAPLSKMPVDMKKELDEFKWHGMRRPTRSSVFDYAIRPSCRVTTGLIAQPLFPIRAQIDLERRRLTATREWEDRSEQVSPEATAWMKTLGFTPGEPRPADATF